MVAHAESTTSTTQASVEANKAIVRRFFTEVCNGRNLEVAAELFAPEHILHDPSLPNAGPGPDGLVQAAVVQYQTGFSDAYWAVEDMIAADDMVVTRWVGHGTHDGELPGLPPATGKRVRVAGTWVQRLDDGKIVESWDVWDTLGMLQQLGVIPGGQ